MYFNKNQSCFLSHSLVESFAVNISRGLHLLYVCVCVCVCVGVVSAGFPGGTVVNNRTANVPMQEMQEMQVRSLGWEDPLE